MYLSALIWFLLPLLSTQSDSGQVVIQEIFVPRNLAQNQTVRLNCALISGEQPVSFEWYFNNAKLVENSNRKIKISEDSSDLIIKSLSVDDIGKYQCRSSNELGSDRKDVDVFFNGEHFGVLNGLETIQMILELKTGRPLPKLTLTL